MIQLLKIIKRYILYCINHLLYLNNKDRKVVKVYSATDTVNYIIENKCSVCRYGDGEFDILFRYVYGEHKGTHFQSYNEDLARRLKDVLSCNSSETHNYLVCIPACMFEDGCDYLKYDARRFWEEYTNTNLMKLIPLLNKDIVYGNSTFTRFYLSHKDKSKCHEYIANLQRIWQNRDIVFVEGEKTRCGVGNDLFSNSHSIRRIIGPATDAFSKYSDILETIKKNVAKSDLILLAMGMTATVLAYDLAKQGYQAIDLGHLDIEYEWMRQGATKKVAIEGKFTNEVKEGHEVQNSTDVAYLQSIIAKVL